MRCFRIVHGALLAVAMAWAVAANAQADAGEEPPAETEETEELDEIVVTVDRFGDPVLDIDGRQEEILRQKVFDEYFRLQQEEADNQWRQADPDLEDKESRIKWGYSPQAEARMRRENDYMYDLPIDQTKPASLFRVEF